MQHISGTDVAQMEKRYRSNFFQSISGYRSVVLLGTRSLSGQENLCIISSLVHVGSNPPLFGFIFRPETVERQSLNYIRQRGIYTLNHIYPEIIDQAHQTSAKYPAHVSEFAAVQLTPEYYDGFEVPYVSESRVKFGLRKVEEHTLVNGCIFLVGKIEHVYFDDRLAIGPDGHVDLTSVQTVTGAGQNAYYAPVFLKRLAYARP